MARNTILMYARMVLLTIIYFYTSRILLQKLGVDDFGIFSLVGSVVAMFESVKILFTSSTQRFFNYVMGQKDATRLNTVFNTSMYINAVIAVFFIILVECAGIWFLNNKANIEEGRMFAAHAVFQMSLAATVLGIVTTPYDAAVIAHEKMDFYAVMTVLDGIIKLIAVFLINHVFADGLIFYGFAVLLSTLTVRVLTIRHCNKNYGECKLRFVKDKQLLRHMTVFAGWQFFGNAAVTITQNGINMILNIFGNTAVNAARGIAYQIRSAVNMFLNNVSVVVNPSVVRSYAEGNTDKMYSIMHIASKTVYILDVIVIVPLLFASENILTLWLGNVPLYSVVFMQILLFNTLIASLHQQLDIVFKAVGKLKYYELCEGTLFFLPVILSYFAMKASMPYHTVFVTVLIFEFIDLITILFIAKKIADLDIKQYLKNVMLPCFVIFLAIFSTWILCGNVSQGNFAIQIVLSAATDILCLAYMIYYGCNKEEKRQLRLLLSDTKLSFLTKFIPDK